MFSASAFASSSFAKDIASSFVPAGRQSVSPSVIRRSRTISWGNSSFAFRTVSETNRESLYASLPHRLPENFDAHTFSLVRVRSSFTVEKDRWPRPNSLSGLTAGLIAFCSLHGFEGKLKSGYQVVPRRVSAEAGADTKKTLAPVFLSVLWPTA